MSIAKQIEKRLAQFFFITTNKDITLTGYLLKRGTDLPITDSAVSDLAQGDSGFDFQAIIANICLIIGLDENFAHREVYIGIVGGVVKQPTQYCLARGVAAANGKHWIDAIGYFKAAAVFASDNFDAHYHLGRIYYQMYSEKAADKTVLKLASDELKRAELIDFRPEVAYFLSYVCFHLQAFTEAFRYAQAALKRGLTGELKDDLLINITIFEDRAKYQIGYRHILARRYQEGLEALAAVSSDGQEDWRVQFFSGVAQRSLGQLPSAVQCFAKACDLNPENGDCYNDLGICYLMMGDFERAKAAFSDGLYKHPDNVDLLCNMGIAHIQMAQFELAAKFLERAAQLAPDSAAVTAALAELKGRK